MNSVPNSERKHIVFVGRRNVGKSSLMNTFAGQELSIISEVAGTTTDPVKKAMELLPFGPVVLVDTAGIDDSGDIGEKRINKTFKAIAGADYAILVIDATGRLHDDEKELIKHLDKISVPYLIAANKIEDGINPDLLKDLKLIKKHHYEISCKENAGITELKTKLTRLLPVEITPPLLSDLVNQGDIIILVVPIDLGAPKGRLILPQVQTIREALDEDTIVVVAKDKELRSVLDSLRYEPKLVVTDSQAITRVAADVPEHIKLTTFSILMARYKGDLPVFIRGIKRIEELQDGDKILVAEACTHHAQQDDIGRVKIPRWLRQHTRKDLLINIVNGIDYPDNISDYKLIIHCGGCMLTRHVMQTRIKQALLLGIPIINYGVIISYMQGAFPRVIIPFEEAMSEWKKKSHHFIRQL